MCKYNACSGPLSLEMLWSASVTRTESERESVQVSVCACLCVCVRERVKERDMLREVEIKERAK